MLLINLASSLFGFVLGIEAIRAQIRDFADNRVKGKALFQRDGYRATSG